MDDFDVALKRLRDTPLSELAEVARATRISRHTLIKIKYRTTKAPRLTVVRKLVAWANRINGAKAESA